MILKEWDKLSEVEKNLLSSKYGITRSGLNNSIINEEELLKIPDVKKEVTKKVRKPAVKVSPKLGNTRGATAKPKSRRKK